MKKVSVIIPMHNSSKHIIECLESVIKQTYKNLEIIVVDDFSSDNSVELVKNIKDNRIKIIELKENVGAARARNKGIEAANRQIYLLFRFRRLLGFRKNRKASKIYGKKQLYLYLWQL